MNQFEKTMVAVLFLGLLLSFYIIRPQKPTAKPADKPVAAETQTNSPVPVAVAEAALTAPAVAVSNAVVATSPVGVAKKVAVQRHQQQEQFATIANDAMDVRVSSWGGAIASVSLKSYRASNTDDSGPLLLDFSQQPSLAYVGLPGISTNQDFLIESAGDGSLQLSRQVGNGLEFSRQITIGNDYRIDVTDTFVNSGTSAVVLPSHSLSVGPMKAIKAANGKVSRFSYLGVDTLGEASGQRVMKWGKKRIPALFGGGGCSRGGPAVTDRPTQMSLDVGGPVAWAAVKNKFFVQILSPDGEGGTSDCKIIATRDLNSSNKVAVGSVAANLVFPEKTLHPGDSYSRGADYYVGPMKYSALKPLGFHRDEVMLYAWPGFGWFRWVCIALLGALNAVYKVIPNYGVAIIVLTIFVKMIFWPIMQKSTASMKKMKDLQPKLEALKKKHKNDSQKFSQAQMALYRQEGVNPMSSCLPMFIQMPVFIAMFTVIRSAVELRYAGFLWIGNLCEPEGLFIGLIPFAPSFAINILPVFMAATMMWQQKLTPQAGDPQQQRMMMIFMPIFMLFIMYNMASGLTLYWTVSQIISIAQLLYQQRGSKPKEA